MKIICKPKTQVSDNKKANQATAARKKPNNNGIMERGVPWTAAECANLVAMFEDQSRGIDETSQYLIPAFQ